MNWKKITPKEHFKRDLSALREIAYKQALFYEFLEQNRDIRFTEDGRKKRSKRFRAAEKFRGKGLALNYYNQARRIYQAWKYLGLSPVKSGKIYQKILDNKIEQVKKSGMNLTLTGSELTWDSVVIYTPKSNYLKNIRDNAYNQNAALVIKAA